MVIDLSVLERACMYVGVCERLNRMVGKVHGNFLVVSVDLYKDRKHGERYVYGAGSEGDTTATRTQMSAHE